LLGTGGTSLILESAKDFNKLKSSGYGLFGAVVLVGIINKVLYRGRVEGEIFRKSFRFWVARRVWS